MQHVEDRDIERLARHRGHRIAVDFGGTVAEDDYREVGGRLGPRAAGFVTSVHVHTFLTVSARGSARARPTRHGSSAHTATDTGAKQFNSQAPSAPRR
ncbi:hypothetical protein [Streptomyces ambofaciens]